MHCCIPLFTCTCFLIQYFIVHCYRATNRSAAQPNVVKENSADLQPVVQLTSPKAGTLEVIRRVQIKLHLISKI
jgi:hypothetical protein